MLAQNLGDGMRAVAEALNLPVLVVLYIFMAASAVLVGSLIVETFTERILLKAKLPQITDRLSKRGESLDEIIRTSGLLKRQISVLNEIVSRPEVSPEMRESLAARLTAKEQSHYDLILKISDVVVRLGPMFGLLGTLVPLGPGLIALGRGDTLTLSQSLLTAFDTTIIGLITAAVCFVISTIRKKWYAGYMDSLDMVTETLLEAMKQEELQHETNI
ncbi:MAG: MotA/TolQ/ExbB proton channel family protein [Oscillospiraceae bacterium]|jgi:biopolymer transport protein ExbB/TolQ|nr:MotA/TolQ/ExbB proton channel family protein [Oscillospiraceae bacterium]